MELTGKVVVVPVELADLATRMATLGATVVLVGPDAGALGRLAGDDRGGRRRPAGGLRLRRDGGEPRRPGRLSVGNVPGTVDLGR